MKKNKLWAKLKIREELEGWQNIEGGIDEDGINYVLNIIDQLDEPETLSLDWIDDNKKDSGVYDIGYYIPVNKLYGKVVSNKKELDQAYKDGYYKGIELMEVMNMQYEDGEFVEKNESTFLDIINGKPYEVEKEKLYRVSMYGITDVTLLTLEDDEYYFDEPLDYVGERPDIRQEFTESEIKALDGRYWLFAVEATE